jgi:ribosomal protein S18 acetylase RimI-like enzyme
MSKVAVEDGRVVGTVLCGKDGRRGYLYHLCVDELYRRKGLGRKLVASCLEDLEKAGIARCHLFIFGGNEAGKQFWRATGWQERLDISLYSKNIG